MIYLDPYLEYKYKDTFYSSKWAAANAAFLNGVEGSQLFNQIKAVLARTDSFFGNIDTTQEPVESWEELLKQRALQLRENLPKLNVSFSGGADSYTMLNAFASNNIKVDKIFVGKTNIHNNPKLNWEIDNFAIPMLKEFNLKGTTIIIDGWNSIDEWIPYAVDEKKYWEEGYELLPNTSVSTQRVAQHLYLGGEPTIRGTTEPRVYYKDGWRAEMWDSDNWRNAHAGPCAIPFFSDPLHPKLHLKQLHLTKNELIRTGNFTLNTIGNSSEYKKIYQKATRYDIPKHYDMTLSPYFVKNDNTSHNPFDIEMYSKKLDFFKSLYKHDKKLTEKILHTVTSKIGGIPLYRHKHGCRIFDIPLA